MTNAVIYVIMCSQRRENNKIEKEEILRWKMNVQNLQYLKIILGGTHYEIRIHQNRKTQNSGMG